jgi:hypothetical protein
MPIVERTVTTSSEKIMASLLPYLQRGEGNLLRLSLFPDGAERSEKAYPFALVDDCAPYSRVIEATITTDAGTLLKKVFLQIQKDAYTVTGDSFRQVTNPHIEAAWQLSRAACDVSSQVLLSSQTDRQGRLAQQASLYYCRQRDLFFHPPCPSCGTPLDLCRDDEFLRASGLSPYSGSAKRYLYCSSCCSAGLPEVYLYERDHSDPLSVKDRWSLLERFGMIDEDPAGPGAFPCTACPELGACYGPNKMARSRVVPFSFYPFYLLCCDAPSLHALEFLPLAAGDPFDEVEQGLDPLRDAARLSCLRALKPFLGGESSLFPRSEERFFLEVLFLKLSYLSGVLQRSVLQDGPSGRKLGQESIWVRLAPPGGALPTLWSAGVEIINDISPRPSQLTLRKYAPDDIAHLGLAWFQTLVGGRQVTAAALLHAVVEYISGNRGESLLPESAGLQRLAAAENLFWTPQARSLPAEWLSLWQRSCAIGFQILDAAAEPGSTLSGLQVADSLRLLIAEVKDAMFSTPSRQRVPAGQRVRLPDAMAHPESDPPELASLDAASAAAAVDALLRGVVAELIQETHARLQGAHAARSVAPGAPGTPSAPGAPGAPGDLDELDELDEDELATVIISPSVMTASRSTREYDEIITETVLLSAPRPLGSAAQSAPNWTKDEILETVVLDPNRAARQGGDLEQGRGGSAPSPPTPPADEGDLLGETVVITPHRDKPRR